MVIHYLVFFEKLLLKIERSDKFLWIEHILVLIKCNFEAKFVLPVRSA
jgi:hypothetical protein